MIRDNFKLSFNCDRYDTTTKFFVNEKKGTVVCMLEGVLHTPTFNDVYVHDTYIKVYGIAKCANGDVFDVERGKRIALAKAENKAYLTALRYVEPYINDIKSFLESYDLFSDKAYHTCAHNEEYISRISCEAHPEYVKDLKELKRGR